MNGSLCGVNIEVYRPCTLHIRACFLPFVFFFTCSDGDNLTVELGLGGLLPSVMSV